MLQLIQNNLQCCPKTLPNLIWDKISHGIELNDKELEYFRQQCKINGIIKFGLVENGCWILNSYGSKYWYKFGKRHRENGPAVEYPNGTKEYWINGLLHREGGPAIEVANGTKEYYINGNLIDVTNNSK